MGRGAAAVVGQAISPLNRVDRSFNQMFTNYLNVSRILGTAIAPNSTLFTQSGASMSLCLLSSCDGLYELLKQSTSKSLVSRMGRSGSKANL